MNTVDNCAYLSNAAQTDSNSDGVGDDCETDSDGDGAPDYNDTCPFNPSISRTSFKSHFTVDLYPSLNTSSPAWLIKSDEVEVLQTTNTGMPTMLIGMLTEVLVLTKICNSEKTFSNFDPALTLKAPPIICSRRQLKILSLFQN